MPNTTQQQRDRKEARIREKEQTAEAILIASFEERIEILDKEIAELTSKIHNKHLGSVGQRHAWRKLRFARKKHREKLHMELDFIRG
jgi:hypothetical protein